MSAPRLPPAPQVLAVLPGGGRIERRYETVTDPETFRQRTRFRDVELSPGGEFVRTVQRSENYL